MEEGSRKTAEKTTPKSREKIIDLGTAGLARVTMTPDEAFEDWPYEAKLECLNLIMLFRNIGLLPERIFQEKYAAWVEKYEDDMLDMMQFMDYSPPFNRNKRRRRKKKAPATARSQN